MASNRQSLKSHLEIASFLNKLYKPQKIFCVLYNFTKNVSLFIQVIDDIKLRTMVLSIFLLWSTVNHLFGYI